MIWSSPGPIRLVVVFLAVAAALRASVRAEPPANLGPREALAQAEELFAADKLVEAEPLYARALAGGAERRRCYDRLLTISVRLGRADEALRLTAQYRELLRRDDDHSHDRELDLLAGECYLVLGHYRTAEPLLERAATADGPLPPLKKLDALTHLARSAQKRGDRDRAERCWAQVERAAADLAEDPRRPLPPRQRIDCVRKLADSCRFQGRPDKALAQLEPLAELHDQLDDPLGKRDTLRLVAACHAAQGDQEAAEKDLRAALALHRKHDAADRLTAADLEAELADRLDRRRRHADARRARTQAADDYRAVLDDPRAGGPRRGGAVAAFWKLQSLYQQGAQYRQALQLTAAQAEQWGGGLLLEPRLKTEEGSLELLLGSYARARDLLRAAVADLEKQSPLDLVELPRALNNLALVEQATDQPDRAEQLGRRCLELYRRHELPDDLILVETHNLLGCAAAQRGDYPEAVARFKAGVAVCVNLGEAADPPRSNLLLNVALLHRCQGDLDEALKVLGQALAVYRRFAEPDALGFAAFDAARANLLAARGQLPQAYALTDGILERCREHKIDGGQMVAVARHCQGLYFLSRRQFADAEKAWGVLRAQQEKEKQSLLLPRTLNYQALSAELQGRFEEAEKLYGEARALQRKNPRAYPATHFITLWRLAGLADRAGRRPEARALLEEAVAVAEAARRTTYGDAARRAEFFAQFAPAFDQLVDEAVRSGDVEAAFAASARSRSRTLLDQLQAAGVDPRAGLQGAEGDQLRRREQELGRRLSALRARAQLIPLEALETDQAKQLLAEFDQAQADYAMAWRDVLDASPAARPLAAPDPAAPALAALRGKALGERTLLLVYHLGRERSYLFLLGGRRAEAFPLTIPKAVAERMAAPEAPAERGLDGTRGLEIRKRGDRPPAPPAPDAAPAGPAVPLTQALARALVEAYRDQVSDPDFRPTRGLRLPPRDPGKPVPAQRLELAGDVLLPPEARKRLRDAAPDVLVVVPDGALHQLPLEALLFASGARPRYGLDELPPIAYAPSAAALGLLAGRPPSRAAATLLTVADPAYPEEDARPRADRREGAGLLGLRGQLPRLPFTAEESKRVRACFDSRQVTALQGAEATERAVAAALPGKRYVHIAAHGFADERFGNLFGALALTPPPGKETPEDDGFLSLGEICRLPLQDCELAVLSACSTNVGPQRPLEAGVTLAGGFLTAGARRVVASHWSVDDRSTAELMGAFFQDVAEAAGQGKKVSYAAALRRAQRQARDRRPAPFYWAPFVLIGPAQ
jgi:CHAT domain-containing protein